MTAPAGPPVRREDLQPEEVLCAYCTAKCCKYFALPIETPTTHKDFDFCRWYLLHEGASLFVEEDSWYLCVHAVCQHLQEDQRCGIYETRPQICRDYSTKDCEYDGDGVYDQCFEAAQQVEEYREAVLGAAPGGTYRTPEPPVLPLA